MSSNIKSGTEIVDETFTFTISFSVICKLFFHFLSDFLFDLQNKLALSVVGRYLVVLVCVFYFICYLNEIKGIKLTDNVIYVIIFIWKSGDFVINHKNVQSFYGPYPSLKHPHHKMYLQIFSAFFEFISVD
jgi:hypothetical protein